MLMLSRKKGESVTIDEKVVVKVVSTSKTGCKLAIDAPREVPILRTELIEQPTPESQIRDEEDTSFGMSFLSC